MFVDLFVSGSIIWQKSCMQREFVLICAKNQKIPIKNADNWQLIKKHICYRIFFNTECTWSSLRLAWPNSISTII